MCDNCTKKEQLDYVLWLATRYFRETGESVQIYKKVINKKIIFDFEPINKERKHIVKIIE